METWMYFAFFFSHVAVAWMFYQKGIRDTVAQYTFEQEQIAQQQLWENMTRQFRGEQDGCDEQ